MLVSLVLLKPHITKPSVGCLAQSWNVGISPANFPCPTLDLQLTGVCVWQPIPSGLNLVVAAVLRDSLCRVIAAQRGRLLYVVSNM